MDNNLDRRNSSTDGPRSSVDRPRTTSTLSSIDDIEKPSANDKQSAESHKNVNI